MKLHHLFPCLLIFTFSATAADAAQPVTLRFESDDWKSSDGLEWFSSRPDHVALREDEILKSKALTLTTNGAFLVAELPAPLQLTEGQPIRLIFRAHLVEPLELRIGLYNLKGQPMPASDGREVVPAINSALGIYADLKQDSIQINAEDGSTGDILFGDDREYGRSLGYLGGTENGTEVSLLIEWKSPGAVMVTTTVNGEVVGTTDFKREEITSFLEASPFQALVIASTTQDGMEGGTLAIDDISITGGKALSK